MNIVITAGPTREEIDPVRFISNHSTGTMGYEIARTAKRRGHRVTLISGYTNLRPVRGVKFVSVITTAQMLKAVRSSLLKADVLIMAAAVSDYAAKVGSRKSKVKNEAWKLTLRKNPDILKSVARLKDKRIFVGFALETENLIKNAREKLKNKKLDFIVANEIALGNMPFGAGKTSVAIIGKEGCVDRMVEVTKRKVAGEIIRRVEKLYKKLNIKNQKSNIKNTYRQELIRYIIFDLYF